MHSTYKFTSKDVIKNKEFNFMNWLKDRAEEILEDSKKKLVDYQITPKEEVDLLKLLIEEKGMTLHFYFAGSITESDIKKLRGYASSPVIKAEDKCGVCKRLLNSPSKGDLKDKEFPELCIECGKAKRALRASAISVIA